MSASTSRRRVSYAQLEILWEFLNTHRDIAMGYNKSVQARENMRRLWNLVTESLNAIGEGAFKDWKGWSAYWIDFKGKLKRKCASLRTSQSRTGGGPPEVPELTEIEKKYLIILGEDFGAGLPGVQVNPFPQSDNNAFTEGSTPNVLAPCPTMEIEIQQVDTEYIEEPVRSTEEVVQSSAVMQPASTEPQVVADTEPTRRRRRRMTPPFTQEAARRSLVDSYQQQLQIEAAKSQTLMGIERVLTRIADTLERIERRLPDVLPTADL